MNDREARAFGFLLAAAVLVALACAALAYGRTTLTWLGLEIAPGTLLIASPRKSAALLLLAVCISAVVTPWAAWSLRTIPRVRLVAVLLAWHVVMFTPPLLVSASVVRVGDRLYIQSVQMPIWPAWSDPEAIVRRSDNWALWERNVQKWVRETEPAIPLPEWASDPPTRIAVTTMHLVSQLWAPGNLFWFTRAGCVRDNEDLNFAFVPQSETTLATYLRSRIACCDDYAHMLYWLLLRQGIQSRIFVAGGHVFLEAKLSEHLRLLDPMSNLLIDASWEEVNAGKPASVLLFSHAATLAGSPTFRPRFAIDRWRLIDGVYGGGLKAIVRPGLPPEFPR